MKEKNNNKLNDSEKLKEYFSSEEDDFYAEYTLSNNKQNDTHKNIEQNSGKNKEVDEFFDEVEKEEREEVLEKTNNLSDKKNIFSNIKVSKKATIFAVIFIVLASFVCYFTQNLGSSEDKIKNYLDVIFVKDSENIYEKYLSSNTNEHISGFDSDLREIKKDFTDMVIGSSVQNNFSESEINTMLLNTLKNVDYKVNSVDVIGSSAKINITLYVPDYEDIFILAINETINQNQSSQLSDEEYLVKLIENYNQLTESNINKTSDISFNLTFTKSEGIWHCSDTYNLTNKLFSRVNSGVNNAYMDVVNRIEF